jgi:hypothetical protein
MKFTLSKSINVIAIISDEDNHINISTRHPAGRGMFRAIMRYITEEGHTLYDTNGVCLIGDVGELMGEDV